MPARKPSGRPTGNPKAHIDWNLVDNLLKAGCPGTEIAPHFDICEDTLYIRCEKEKGVGWSAYLRQKRSQGDANLRAKQYTEALKGDRTLLIWLGKQRLGQRENDATITVTPETAIQFKAVMDQLDKAQASALNNADTSNITESRS